jgi:DNA topoisomerase-1
MRRPPRTPRLRRSDCSAPGLTRVRRGRGFSYLDAAGQPVADPETLQRVRELGIPPAWQQVWICPDARGHLQATGIDAAGRKQYLYHAVWREQRDRQKFQVMEAFAAALPRLRRAVADDLASSTELTRERVLACAARMLDVGLFRVGGEEYAKQDGGIGLATLRRTHVTVRSDGREVVFDYPGKSGVQRRLPMSDPDVVAVISALRRRRGGLDELLAFRTVAGRPRWQAVRSEDINDYIKAHMGEGFSAKDFRTWNATVLAAVFLARRWRETSTRTSRKRAISAVAREVSEHLGNTPAVARRSYIDPRVFDRYAGNMTIATELTHIEALDETSEQKRRRIERAVLDLLAENVASSAVEVHDLPQAA